MYQGLPTFNLNHTCRFMVSGPVTFVEQSEVSTIKAQL
jgi:hypothetical protein